ncbi:MAG: circularly permuted type 2 ATP-grasp protein [Gammaproteobacteria bacterium]|nr:circularly permuted type 2 ATP-grasp protein [Gammaproteobacteria bacterium]
MFAAPGQPRAHWRYLHNALEQLQLPELQARQLDARRLLREDGASYNVYGDPTGMGRPWGLDPIPLLISSEEWSSIETGLIQRAELLNLILADIYGPRELVRKRLLPPQLIFDNPAFLRPCDGISLPGQHQLTLCAMDLARDDQGQIWVTSDRTQVPSGLGYALENRTIMSRVLPSLYRDSHVHRLALFFRTLRNTLGQLCRRESEDPRVVLLTPGPRNETYFEQAYLATYLGYNLVDGADLTVRGGRLWLRSLGGLEPVDVVLRRVDDTYCDPLELRKDSYLGVPGLVEVARRGKVAIANPLGSGILENAALSAFLPAISKHFLGQALRLPSAPAWWCGDDAGLRYVLEHLDTLVIRTVRKRPGEHPLFGNRLNAAERQALADRIRKTPELFVGQAQLSASKIPTLTAQGLEPRSGVMRTFLVARDDSYVAMPGGLTRIAPDSDSLLITNQMGALSKDTWVLASEPEKQDSRLQTIRVDHSTEAYSGLPSRAAENFFWMGRYAERAEFTLRMLRTVTASITDPDPRGSQLEQQHHLQVMLHTVNLITGFKPVNAQALNGSPQTELRRVLVDGRRGGSVHANLAALLNASDFVRDRLSADTRQVLSDLLDEQTALTTLPEDTLDGLGQHLNRIIKSLMALSGLTQESFVHGPGWRFLAMGRRIERGLMLITLIRASLSSAQTTTPESSVIDGVLSVSESLMIYRRGYQTRQGLEQALELLLLNQDNPRSLIYQLTEIGHHIERLPAEEGEHHLRPEQRSVLEATTLLQLSELKQLSAVDEQSGRRQTLDQTLERIAYLLRGTSDALTARFFTHLEDQHQLSPSSAEEIE